MHCHFQTLQSNVFLLIFLRLIPDETNQENKHYRTAVIQWHLIQSNAFESNASANADESNAIGSTNASITGQSNASASANSAFAFVLADAHDLSTSLVGVAKNGRHLISYSHYY